MSRRIPARPVRSFLAALNPFGGSVDRQLDWKRGRQLRVEGLEDRRLLAIVWANRGDAVTDSDGFNVTYGAMAGVARLNIERAIADWNAVITDFNYDGDGNPTTDNGFTLTVMATDLGGNLRGRANNIVADGNQLPISATLTMDDAGGSGGWFIDPTPYLDEEFTAIVTPFTADSTQAGNDFYRTALHEIGHAVGILLGNGLAINNFLTPAGIDQVTDPADPDENLRVFQNVAGQFGVAVTMTTDGGGHIYEGPADPGFPSAPTFTSDLMNAGRTVGPPATRQLITDLNAMILADAYGYTVALPSTLAAAFVVSDSLEPNNTRATATNLGSEPYVTRTNLSIDTADDEDWYRYTAHHSGKLIINALFDDITGDGLGDIDIAVFDVAGNQIAVANSTDSNEQIILPVVHQQPYFIRVVGAADDLNNYSLEIENFAAPKPSFVDLIASSDTGSSNSDDITSDTTPTLIIQADLVDFRDSGITLLNQATIDPNGDGSAADATDDGAGVYVSLVNLVSGAVVRGFASQVGASGFLWSFTVPNAVALAAGEWFVSTAVQMVDGSDTSAAPGTQRATGRAQLSDPFVLTIVPTGLVAQISADLATSSDTGMFNNDNVTNKMSPAIQGIAPAGSRVRLFANNSLVGQTVTGSDSSDVIIGPIGGIGGGAADGLGLWEITTEPLADGVYDLRVEVEDAAGNVTSFDVNLNPALGPTRDIEIDTNQPNTPLLDLREDSGRDLADEVTNDNSPLVSMTTHDPAILNRLFLDNLKFRIWDRFENNAEYLLFDSAAAGDPSDATSVLGDMFTSLTVLNRTLGQQFIVLNPGGNFAVTAAGLLVDGFHNLKLEVEDRAGNISEDFLLEMLVDTVEPPAVTPNLLDSSDSGMFVDDNVTAINAPAFDGVGEINAKVYVYATRISPTSGNPISAEILIGQGIVGSENTNGVPADGLGRWEVTVEPLIDGVYDISVRFEDLAGNITSLADAAANSLRIVVDTVEPNMPYLDLVTNPVTGDTGRNDVDNITKQNMPLVTMTSEDPNVALAQALFTDNLKVRVYDRYESFDGQNTPEFLLYDSAQDAVEDAFNTAGDMFTIRTLIAEMLPTQFFALFGAANAAVISVAGVGKLADGVHNLKLEVEDRAGNLSHDFLLTIIVDTVTPPGSFGLPDAASTTDGLAPSSDTGVTTMPATYADRVTSDTTPKFWGRAEANSIVRVYVDSNANGIIDLATDVFIGMTVAVPYDGNDAYPEGYWELTSIRDLNEIVGLPKDGLRRLLMTAEDVAGNPMPMNGQISAGVDALNIFIDTQGPQIYDPAGATQAVHPTGVPDYDLFDPKPSVNGFTPLTNSITIHVRDLPLRSNVDPNFLYEALKEDIAEALGNYQLVGDHVGVIGITAVDVINAARVNGQAATATIVLTFNQFLPDDRYTLTVKDNLVDPAGNKLDGESNANGPLDDPTFPSGDGVPGGNFVGRFTIDSRPEIATFIPTTIAIDINGNFVWDPSNGQIGNDATNVDITFAMDRPDLVPGGFATHDTVFAGKFVGGGVGGGIPVAGRYFDQLAVYGYSIETAQHRWLVDFNSDGVADLYTTQPLLANFNVAGALPIAGNFDNNLANGDEIGLFYGGNWAFDFDRNFVITANEVVANTGLKGIPIVGDFDGNGIDDVGVFNNNQFTFGMSIGAFGNFAALRPTFQWGFSGVLERPVTADMDQDGIDDIGLWVPRNSTQTPSEGAEWFFVLSGFAPRVVGTVSTLAHAFTPVPFGNDLYADFGDEQAMPLVGNFDPPVTKASAEPPATIDLPGDFDGSGTVDQGDYTVWKQNYGRTGAGLAGDANGDNVVNLADYSVWRDNLGQSIFDAAVAPELAGDFDDSGTVDQGDYAIWKQSFGATGSGLVADANNDGRVDLADYTVWRDNLGAKLPASAVASFVVAAPTALFAAPEPEAVSDSVASDEAPSTPDYDLAMESLYDDSPESGAMSAGSNVVPSSDNDDLLLLRDDDDWSIAEWSADDLLDAESTEAVLAVDLAFDWGW
jgi:hypothetical protein